MQQDSVYVREDAYAAGFAADEEMAVVERGAVDEFHAMVGKATERRMDELEHAERDRQKTRMGETERMG